MDEKKVWLVIIVVFLGLAVYSHDSLAYNYNYDITAVTPLEITNGVDNTLTIEADGNFYLPAKEIRLVKSIDFEKWVAHIDTHCAFDVWINDDASRAFIADKDRILMVDISNKDDIKIMSELDIATLCADSLCSYGVVSNVTGKGQYVYFPICPDVSLFIAEIIGSNPSIKGNTIGPHDNAYSSYIDTTAAINPFRSKTAGVNLSIEDGTLSYIHTGLFHIDISDPNSLQAPQEVDLLKVIQDEESACGISSDQLTSRSTKLITYNKYHNMYYVIQYRTSGRYLYIIDNPLSNTPSLLGKLKLPDGYDYGFQWNNIVVRGNYAYIVGSRVAHWLQQEWLPDITRAIYGYPLYLTETKLLVIDVSHPEEPVKKGEVELEFYIKDNPFGRSEELPKKVYLVGDFAWIVDQDLGSSREDTSYVRLINISDPDDPYLLDFSEGSDLSRLCSHVPVDEAFNKGNYLGLRFPYESAISNIIVSGDYVYITRRGAGFFIYKLEDLIPSTYVIDKFELLASNKVSVTIPAGMKLAEGVYNISVLSEEIKQGDETVKEDFQGEKVLKVNEGDAVEAPPQGEGTAEDRGSDDRQAWPFSIIYQSNIQSAIYQAYGPSLSYGSTLFPYWLLYPVSNSSLSCYPYINLVPERTVDNNLKSTTCLLQNVKVNRLKYMLF
jgi:hypothetical protein